MLARLLSNQHQEDPMIFSKRHRVGLLVGSLRQGSYSRKLAKALIALAPKALDCRIVEIGDLALYNEDLDGSPPSVWVRFRESIKECDALLFVPPSTPARCQVV